jgi:hypothetical protein
MSRFLWVIALELAILTENELLQDYLHVKDALTISQENRLSNEVRARGKSIEANLQEKDREIAGLREKTSHY